MKKILSLLLLSFFFTPTLFAGEGRLYQEDTIPLPGGADVTNKVGPFLIISKFRGPQGTATVVSESRKSSYGRGVERGDTVVVGFLSATKKTFGRFHKGPRTGSPFNFVVTGTVPHQDTPPLSRPSSSLSQKSRGISSPSLPVRRPHTAEGFTRLNTAPDLLPQ